MSYVIVITKVSPFSDTEAITEMVKCTTKKDLDEKYVALNKRRDRDILSIKVEHFEDGEWAGKA